MSELNEILSALGPEPARGVARRDVFKEVDADGSGEIGFDEFCTCMQKAKEGGATALAVMVEIWVSKMKLRVRRNKLTRATTRYQAQSNGT